MTISRETIVTVVRQWERMAKAEMYLDDYLHPKARQWLVEAIEHLCAQSDEASFVSGDQWSPDEIARMKKAHAQSAAESSGVEQSRVESVQREINKDMSARLRKKGT